MIERKPFPVNSGAAVEAVLNAVGSVNLRIAPSTAAPLVPDLPLGVPDNARVRWYPDVQEQGGGREWTRVTYQQFEGWMARVWGTWGEQFAAPPHEWPPPAVQLPVPFVTQKGTGRNNCGPAALASVVRYWAAKTDQSAWLKTISVNRIATDMNKGTGFASVQQLEAAGKRYGLALYSKSDLSYETITSELALDRPVIALVERGDLNPDFGNFTGSHFVTITGQGDGYLIIDDPLGDSGGDGDSWKVSRETFLTAWETSPGNSRHRVALLIPASAMEPEPDAIELTRQIQALTEKLLLILSKQQNSARAENLQE